MKSRTDKTVLPELCCSGPSFFLFLFFFISFKNSANLSQNEYVCNLNDKNFIFWFSSRGIDFSASFTEAVSYTGEYNYIGVVRSYYWIFSLSALMWSSFIFHTTYIFLPYKVSLSWKSEMIVCTTFNYSVKKYIDYQRKIAKSCTFFESFSRLFLSMLKVVQRMHILMHLCGDFTRSP